jgi:hypothetical protein
VPVAWPRPGALLTEKAGKPGSGGSVIVELPVGGDGAPTGPPREVHQLPDAFVGELATAGDVILVDKMRTQDDVFVAALAADTSLAGPPSRLTLDDARDVPAGWLGDGRVLFRSDRDGEDALFAQVEPLKPAERLGGEGTVRGWSTAGGDVLAWRTPSADAGGACELVRLVDGGWKPLFTAPSDADQGDVVVRCGSELKCARGGRCFAQEKTADATRWSSFDTATGKKLAMVHEIAEGARGWDLSPKGDVIAFTTGNDDAIAYVDVAKRALREIHVSLPAGTTARFFAQFVAYTPDGRHLVLTGMRDQAEAYLLLASDLEGHARVIATTPTSWFNYPFLDAKGTRLAVGEREYLDRFYLLEPSTRE